MSTARTPTAGAARRPLKSRGSTSVRGVASWLARRRVTPNTISLASIGFAAAGAAAMLAGPDWLFVVAAACIQLRLLCNLIDGLVAVEGGLGTPDGEIFNDVPDRVSDTLLLVAAGYAAGVPELGWAAALAAALTAYIRVFGGAVGLEQSFAGLMAKPQRMALLTVACLVAVFEVDALTGALAVITGGALVTCVTRLAAIRSRLR